MHAHLTHELFRAVASGWRNPGDLAGIAIAHLFELCPDCRRGFEGWRQELEDASVPADAADYEAVIDRIRARVEAAPGETEAPVQSEVRRARSRAAELLHLSAEQQLDWIRSESDRLRGPLLAEVLIDEGFRRTQGYPHDGFALASLARLVLHHLPVSWRTAALYARALAHMANAVRVIGDLPRAEQLMGDARYFLRAQGGGDRLVRAELDRLESSLRLGQRRLRSAVTILLRAQMVYELEGLQSEAVATLLLLSKAHRRLGELDRAFELLDQADRGLARTAHPRFTIIAAERRAMLLLQVGKPEVALQVLASLDGLTAEHGDPIMLLRRSWQLGRVSRSLGDLEAAEHSLLQVVEGFSSRRMILDVALARLELSRLYRRQGRMPEAGDLAEQATTTFLDIGLLGMAAEASAA